MDDALDNLRPRAQPAVPEVQATASELPDVSSPSLIDNASRVDQAKKALLAKNWCELRVKNLMSALGIDALEYLAGLDVNSQRIADHSNCTNKPACVAYNVKMISYTTRHVQEQCNCDMVLVPYDELVGIIKSGGIPLVSIEEDSGSGMHLRLKLHKRSWWSMLQQYTAISHVWADGLGNPSENGLPTCQLRQLQDTLHRLEGRRQAHRRKLFWMDTLCIPVKKEDNSLKIRLIDFMPSIYHDASQLLVLDAGLKTTNSFDLLTHLVEATSSVWMTRSWTMQELQLSRKRAFTFANTMLLVDSKATYLTQAHSESQWPEIVQKVHHWDIPTTDRGRKLTVKDAKVYRSVVQLFYRENFGKERPSRDLGRLARIAYPEDFASAYLATVKTKANRLDQFVRAWNALARRSTTNVDDICFILANLLGFSCRYLSSLENNQERLKAMVLSLDFIPFSIFYNTGPKFSSDGQSKNRWVPASLSPDLMTTETFLLRDETMLIPCQGRKNQDMTLYLFREVITPGLKVYNVNLEAGKLEYTVSVLDRAGEDLNPVDLQQFQYTCIAIEDVFPGQSGSIRGAMFYGTIATNMPRQNRVLLVYYSSIKLEKSSHGGQTVAHVPAPIFHGILVDLSHIIIEYDPIAAEVPQSRLLSMPASNTILSFYASIALLLVLAIYLDPLELFHGEYTNPASIAKVLSVLTAATIVLGLVVVNIVSMLRLLGQAGSNRSGNFKVLMLFLILLCFLIGLFPVFCLLLIALALLPKIPDWIIGGPSL